MAAPAMARALLQPAGRTRLGHARVHSAVCHLQLVAVLVLLPAGHTQKGEERVRAGGQAAVVAAAVVAAGVATAGPGAPDGALLAVGARVLDLDGHRRGGLAAHSAALAAHGLAQAAEDCPDAHWAPGSPLGARLGREGPHLGCAAGHCLPSYAPCVCGVPGHVQATLAQRGSVQMARMGSASCCAVRSRRRRRRCHRCQSSCTASLTPRLVSHKFTGE